ncbi:MAG: branched-chain amino acid ABC transporter permease [Deltaproteobacteria bacterium]|nr:branched-chain amino acid ABC transporter permease [Deltaproteobacteria bacterium]
MAFVAAAAGLIAFPLVDANGYHTSVGLMIGIYALANLGLNLLLGNTGQISLGQAAFFGIGAYTAGNISERIDWAARGLEAWGFWFGSLGAALFAGLAGCAIGFFAVRLKGHYLAIATLGFQVIFSTVVLEWYPVTGGPGGFQLSAPVRLGSFDFASDARYFYLTWAFVGIAFVAVRRLERSRIGRALHAIKEYEGLAEACAVSPVRYKLQVFTLAAGLAGFAGSLYAHHVRSIGPASFSVQISLTWLVMIVVGGLGTAWGALVGTASLYVLPEVVRAVSALPWFSEALRHRLSDNNVQGLVFGLVLGVFVLFVPKGVVGTLDRRRRAS